MHLNISFTPSSITRALPASKLILYDLPLSKKKNEFGQAKLYMNKTNKSEDLNYLIGIDNNFLFEKELVKGITNNNYIYNLFY